MLAGKEQPRVTQQIPPKLLPCQGPARLVPPDPGGVLITGKSVMKRACLKETLPPLFFLFSRGSCYGFYGNVSIATLFLYLRLYFPPPPFPCLEWERQISHHHGLLLPFLDLDGFFFFFFFFGGVGEPRRRLYRGDPGAERGKPAAVAPAAPGCKTRGGRPDISRELNIISRKEGGGITLVARMWAPEQQTKLYFNFLSFQLPFSNAHTLLLCRGSKCFINC